MATTLHRCTGINGGSLLGEVLAAVRAQEGVADEVELLVIDLGSTDGSRELARLHGARVEEIPRGQFFTAALATG